MYKFQKHVLGGLLLTFGMSIANAQTFDIDSASVEEGTTEATVEWSFLQEGGDIHGFGVDIIFDDSVITPQTTDVGGVDEVDGCLSNVEGSSDEPSQTNCEQINATTIRVTLNNLDPSDVFPDFAPGGSITFDIAGSATAGDSSPLTLSVASVQPTGSSIATNDGSVSITAGPSSVNYEPNPGTLIDFGSAEQNSGSSTSSVQICNDGGTGSVVSVTDVSISPAQFTQDGGCDGAALEAGATDCCTIEMTFAPDDTGNFTGSLSVETDAEEGEGTNGNASFDLEGEGVAGPAPDMSISPTEWTTDANPGATTSQTFTVTNNGETDSVAEMGAASLADGSEFTVTADNCDGASLNGTDSCTIDVEFAPGSAGDFSDTLNVPATDTVNNTDVSQSASLNGTGNGPIFSSNPAPGTVSLGQTPPGGTLDQDVVISNDGNEDLDASCGSLNDPDGVFTLTPDPANFDADNGNAIASGGSATFNVACTVPDVSSYEATLQCSTNEGTEGQVYDYTFRCTGRPLVIPTMQPWGLVVLTMLMLMVGGLSIRYFRV
ncbi:MULTISPECIES: choice-of-anchor D domain-containing protein [unclassified Wenzhouxiangella]|uniref:choice-of-anchor D domain-containing protein n=1 Tax=unclassified Wenzhouxiangella TaxID=2613841 RepID=UPI000E32AF4C|nr:MULTISPECIES: choice-of-anchor D domain-containing protein [unclassified Wenzhouxiangella]RFF28114.1 choice-of-anchor D domain-containing protein [Wenzhouxiangella sp. 15181]RFP68089.1 choice-of-anchor D domain-containing protein [Wenzhouxiangella sp. 15190]